MKAKIPEFLELSKDILDRGWSLRFQAKGWSMFPAVRQGDILTVWPVSPDEIKPQDIIFFRTKDSRVIAHRVIKKFQTEERIVLSTRGDFFRGQYQQVSFENVLGKVSGIERNGRSFNICEGKGKLKDKILFTLSPLIETIRKSLSVILFNAQSFRLYRNFIRGLIKLDVSYQKEPLDDFSERICAKVNNAIIAETTVNKFKEKEDMYQGWWIFGTWVGWRFRRMGIGEQLTNIACEVAANKGATEVMLLVFKDNNAAVKLYQKLGFYKVSIPKIDDELKVETEQTGRLRIIMKKDL